MCIIPPTTPHTYPALLLVTGPFVLPPPHTLPLPCPAFFPFPSGGWAPTVPHSQRRLVAIIMPVVGDLSLAEVGG